MKKFTLKLNTPAGFHSFELPASDLKEESALAYLADAGTIVCFGPELEEIVFELFEQVDPELAALEELRSVIDAKYPGGGVGMTLQETSPGVFVGNLHHSKGAQVRVLCNIEAQPSRLAGVQALLAKAKELVP